MIEVTKENYKVSVCVVTYNQENYIRQCLQSIVDQKTDFKFEVIVGDDCSTDGTRAIVQEFADKYPRVVRPIFHEQNMGAFKNFVTTHNRASTKFVAHCDGDDLFLPDKLQKQVNYLEMHSDCSVVWHRLNVFDDSGNFIRGETADYSMLTNRIVTLDKSLRYGSIVSQSSIMYRRSARKTFNPDFDATDLFYAWEYLCSGYGIVLDDVLGEHRINSVGSISSNQTLHIKFLMAHHAKYFLKKCPERRTDIFLFSLINLLADIKNKRKSAIKFFWLVLRSFSIISPAELISYFREARKFGKPLLSEKR